MARFTRFCGVPILAASVLFGTITGLAQTQSPTRAPRAPRTNQAAAPAAKGNLTPVPGQRRGMTDAMRRAAAARNAARRAAAGRNQVALPAQQGVKK
jgi:hypothetical protein